MGHRRALRIGLSLIAFTAGACLKDSPLGPSGTTGEIRLAITAQVADALGQAVEVVVYYTRLSGEQVLLPSDPAQIPFTGVEIQVPVTVDLGPCLRDPQRITAQGTTAGCEFTVKLRLLDGESAPIDSNMTPVSAPVSGTVVRVTPPPLGRTLPRFTVTVEAASDNQGPGLVTGNGINCTITNVVANGTCQVVLPQGTAIQLAAQGTNSNALAAWGGSACTGTGACAFQLTADTTVTASFTASPPTTAVLTVRPAADDHGPGHVTGNGIDCFIVDAQTTSGTCSQVLPKATAVALIAAGTSGSHLLAWGGACDGSGACSFTLDSDSEVTADFSVSNVTLTVEAGASNAGPGLVTGNGLDCAVPSGPTGIVCNVTVPKGTQISLVAQGTNNNHLSTWEAPCTATAATCDFTINENTTVRANFTAPSVSLNIARATENQGPGRVTGNGLDCNVTLDAVTGPTCTVSLAPGTAVVLSATGTDHNSLTAWGAPCAGAAPAQCTFTMPSGDATVTVAFATPTVTLQVQAGAGTAGPGLVTGNGLNCAIPSEPTANVCSVRIPKGTAVSLSARGTDNNQLGTWEGPCLATAPSCDFTINDDAVVKANFTAPSVTLAVQATSGNEGPGHVSGNGLDCNVALTGVTGPTCTVSLAPGTLVTLQAVGTSNNALAAWSGACQGSNPCSFSMPDNGTTVGVSFTAPPPVKVTLDIRAAVGNAGAGRVTGNAIDCTISGATATGTPGGGTCTTQIDVGTQITLTEAGTNGNTFASWGGPCTGAIPTCNFTIATNSIVTAAFTPPPPARITVAPALPSIFVGQSSTVAVQVFDAENRVIPNAEVTWSVAPSGVLELSSQSPASATVTGRVPATAVITATSTTTPSVSGQATVQVLPGPTLTIIASGNGSGTVESQTGLNPATQCVITDGEASASGCAVSYPYQAPITIRVSTSFARNSFLTSLSAVAANCVPPTGLPPECTFTMTDNVSVQATLVKCEVASLPLIPAGTPLTGYLGDADCVEQFTGTRSDFYLLNSLGNQSAPAYYLHASQAEFPLVFDQGVGAGAVRAAGDTYVLYRRDGTPPGPVGVTSAAAPGSPLGTYSFTPSQISSTTLQSLPCVNILTSLDDGGPTNVQFGGGGCAYSPSIGGSTTGARLYGYACQAFKVSMVPVTPGSFEPLIEIQEKPSDNYYPADNDPVIASSASQSGTSTATVTAFIEGCSGFTIRLTARSGPAGPFTMSIDPP